MLFRFFASLLCLLSSTSGSVLLSPSSLNIEPNDESIAEKWEKAGDIIEPLIWPYRRPLIEVLHKVVSEADFVLSEGCNRSLSLALEALQNRDLWAYQMMDASSKFSPGFLNTQYTDYGDINQCLGIEVNNPLNQFSGKYCLYRIHFPLPEYQKHSPANMSLFGNKIEGKWLQSVAQNYKAFYYETINNAICVPSTCSAQEFQAILGKYVFQHPFKVTFWPECDTTETVSIPFSKQPLYTQISGIIVITWASFVVLATLITSFVPRACPSWASSLSMALNAKSVFREPSNSNAMECVSVPLKLIFLTLGLYIHTFFGNLLIFGPPSTLNLIGWFNSRDRTVSHGIYSNLDIFNPGLFALSGAMTYFVWHEMMKKSGGKLRFSTFIVPRLVRCFPLVAMPILFTLAFPLVPGMGPIYRHFYKDMAAKCYRYFLYDLIFATNLPFVHPNQLSHLITWAMAVDVQLYASSFWAIYLLYNKPKTGLILTFGLLLGTTVAQGVVMHVMDTNAITDFADVDMKKTTDDFGPAYLSTLANAPVFYLGILVGYALANRVIISKTNRLIGWATFSICFLFYGIYYNQYSQTLEIGSYHWFIIMGILRKPLFCAFCSWVCYGIFHKEKAFAWFSTVKPPVYVSRIFGSINIAHFSIVSYMAVSTKKPFENNSLELVQRMTTLITLSLALGFLVHLLFEAPLNNLSNKMIFPQPQPKPVKVEKTN